MIYHKIIIVFTFGVLISLLWRLSNIKNNKINFLNNTNNKVYYDNVDMDPNILKIDFTLVFIESILGSLFAVFISYLLVIIGIINLKNNLIIPYDFVTSFFAIPGYSIFIRLRLLINDFVTKYLPKKLTEL